MPKYRVKPRVTFGPAGIYKPGDVVELTEEEAKGFLDKLIPLGNAAKPAVVSAVPPPPALRNDLKAEIPAEMKLLPDDEDESDGFNFDEDEIVEDAGTEETEKPKRTSQRKKK